MMEGAIYDLGSYGKCPRCKSNETVGFCAEYGEGANEDGRWSQWRLSLVCSDCGNEFDIFDGSP